MAKQLCVAKCQGVGCGLTRVLQQLTGVCDVFLPWQEGSKLRRDIHTLEALKSHKTERKYKYHITTRNKHKGTCSKVCGAAAVWPGGVPVRGMGTITLTWDAVLSQENKDSVRTRLGKACAPRGLPQAKKIRSAAVLIPLCHVEGELSLLYTVRCLSMELHRGEVSFPGGMADPGDRDEVHTALRETQEEVGLTLDANNVEVLGMLPAMSSSASKGTKVVGVLAYVGHIDLNTLKPNPTEVDTIVVASLRKLTYPPLVRHTQFRSTSTSFPVGYTLPVFLGTEPRVWGLTAALTHIALNALLPGLYTHRFKHIQPLNM